MFTLPSARNRTMLFRCVIPMPPVPIIPTVNRFIAPGRPGAASTPDGTNTAMPLTTDIPAAAPDHRKNFRRDIAQPAVAGAPASGTAATATATFSRLCVGVMAIRLPWIRSHVNQPDH
jgi:hypothetical protein